MVFVQERKSKGEVYDGVSLGGIISSGALIAYLIAHLYNQRKK
ncbi:MAG: hypothetical protein AABX24_03030 [Nanoarchaeota archaeon]